MVRTETEARTEGFVYALTRDNEAAVAVPINLNKGHIMMLYDGHLDFCSVEGVLKPVVSYPLTPTPHQCEVRTA
ncbi:hypothetical protein TNCV_2048131 [Trichonephila clavipes]|nr:hypothetical protein TNCV_2048131 [Trichonephila clavipes]